MRYRFAAPLALLASLATSSALEPSTPTLDYIFTFSGTITDRYLNFPDPSITIGSPFTASFHYSWPGTPVIADPGLGWYSFTDAQQQGSVTVADLSYSFTGGNILIWHEQPSYSTLMLECTGQGLVFRPVLSTTDLALLQDTSSVPTSLSLDDFDQRREFQIFSGWPNDVSIAGQIQSFSLTVVPEPASLPITLLGLLAMFCHGHRRTLDPQS